MLAATIILASAPALGGGTWRPRRDSATRFAKKRAGSISFAALDQKGHLYGYRARRQVPAASVLKVMFMTAYLRHPSVRNRKLNSDDKDLLAPMIRWSDNDSATRIANMVGERRMRHLARVSGMKRFEYTRPWGLSLITARDQVRFLFRLERYIPEQHRGYARWLLSHIVRAQRWGIPPVVPDGWRVYFKGGWGTGTGRVTHQVAFLKKKGERRVTLAIMTEHNPSHEYGTHTIRGVARRLLRGLP